MPVQKNGDHLAIPVELCKEAHGMTLRISPPLVITRNGLDAGLNAVIDVLTR